MYVCWKFCLSERRLRPSHVHVRALGLADLLMINVPSSDPTFCPDRRRVRDTHPSIISYSGFVVLFLFFIEEKFYTNGDIYWTEVGVQERTLSCFIIRSSAWVNCHKRFCMSYQSAVQQGVILKVNYHLNEGNIVTSVPSLRLKSTSCVNHFTDK